MPDRIEPLLEDLIERSPSWLRAVVHYDGEDVTHRYFRSDLETGDGPDPEAAAVFGELIGTGSDGDSPFGEPRYQLRAYESTVLIHVPEGDEGVLLTIDGDAVDGIPSVLRGALSGREGSGDEEPGSNLGEPIT